MNALKIGIGVPSIGRFLPFVAQTAGFFQRENIPVEIVNQRDEEQAVPDIVSGATPIGTPNAPSLVFSALEGNDIVIVAGLLNRPAFFLAANSNVSTVAELRGKRVGINQPRRMAGMVMLALLRKWGFDVDRDLTVVDSGINDRSFEVLMEGKIDAALLPPEKAYLAEAHGLRIIADSLDLDCHWVPLATTRSFLGENRELVRKVTAIYRESAALFKSRPQETLESLRHWLPALAKAPLALEKCYALFAGEFDPTLQASDLSLQSILDEVALQDGRARDYKPSMLVEKLL